MSRIPKIVHYCWFGGKDMPELAVLLEENFLQDEMGRWYIPDVTKEGDVAKLREKKLWREKEFPGARQT